MPDSLRPAAVIAQAATVLVDFTFAAIVVGVSFAGLAMVYRVVRRRGSSSAGAFAAIIFLSVSSVHAFPPCDPDWLMPLSITLNTFDGYSEYADVTMRFSDLSSIGGTVGYAGGHGGTQYLMYPVGDVWEVSGGGVVSDTYDPVQDGSLSVGCLFTPGLSSVVAVDYGYTRSPERIVFCIMFGFVFGFALQILAEFLGFMHRQIVNKNLLRAIIGRGF